MITKAKEKKLKLVETFDDTTTVSLVESEQ